MPTLTTNYSLNKPLVADAIDEDLWGGYLNDNFDTLDTTIKAVDDATYCITASKSSAYTILTTDRNKLILVDATGGAVTITLPAAATAEDGFSVTIKKIDSSTNAVTIDGDASETIDGATTYVISSQYESVSVVSDATKWHIKEKLDISGNMSTAKAWGYFDASSGSVSGFSKEYNMLSVTRNSTGLYTLVMDNSMDSSNYVVIASALSSAGISGNVVATVDITDQTTFRINIQNNSAQRDASVWFVVFGVLA